MAAFRNPDPSTNDQIGAGWLGQADLAPRAAVVAGSHGSWSIQYRAGVSGIDEGGRIRIVYRTVADWAAPQFTDPRAPNYVTVASDAPVTLTPEFAVVGVRPWSKALTVRVADGSLRDGDTLTMVLGDTRGGSPGMRAQTYPERNFRFKVLVDAFGSGSYEWVADLGLAVIGGEATQFVVVAPSDVVAGEPAWLQVRALDRWGNPAPGYRGRVRFSGALPAGLPEAYAFTADDAGVHRFEGLRFPTPGIATVSVTDGAGLVASGNPTRCHAEAPVHRVFWGDLHGQTEETVGTGSLEEYFTYARDIAAVEVVGHQGNDFQITNDVWADIQTHAERFNAPGHFVAFQGYEWSGNTPAGGDHNVHFLGDGTIHRSSHMLIPNKRDVASDRYPVDELYATFAGRDDVLLVPHIGGRPASLEYHDPQLEPAIEIASQWGRFEWFARDALDRGYRVGFIGGSDDHSGRPGWSAPTLAHHGVRGGLSAFLATDLTRDAIWDALRARRCYGTSGPRILLDVDMNGSPMGAELTSSEPPTLRCRVVGTAPLDTVEVRRGLETVHTATIRPLPAPDDPWRVRIAWRGARVRGRARALDWTGGLTVRGGRIVAVENYATDSPDDGVTAWDEASVRWVSHTVGDWDGVILDLAGDDDTLLDVQTPTMSFATRLGDLGTAGIDYPGALLEQRVVVQRLAANDGPSDAAIEWRDDAPLRGSGMNAYWVWVTQMDGELAWSSPVYLTWSGT